jgi:hypothetical protein
MIFQQLNPFGFVGLIDWLPGSNFFVVVIVFRSTRWLWKAVEDFCCIC